MACVVLDPSFAFPPLTTGHGTKTESLASSQGEALQLQSLERIFFFYPEVTAALHSIKGVWKLEDATELPEAVVELLILEDPRWSACLWSTHPL